MPPEDDPRDDVETWPCRTCNGRGVIGTGGSPPLCPRCLGAGDDPTPYQPGDDMTTKTTAIPTGCIGAGCECECHRGPSYPVFRADPCPRCNMLPAVVAPAPFPNVDLPRMYPPQSVPDHVVLMSFNGDSDAEAFSDWWHSEGSAMFSRWFTSRAR